MVSNMEQNGEFEILHCGLYTSGIFMNSEIITCSDSIVQVKLYLNTTIAAIFVVANPRGIYINKSKLVKK